MRHTYLAVTHLVGDVKSVVTVQVTSAKTSVGLLGFAHAFVSSTSKEYRCVVEVFTSRKATYLPQWYVMREGLWCNIQNASGSTSHPDDLSEEVQRQVEHAATAGLVAAGVVVVPRRHG